jgi:class 3 adenylate cyclase
MERSRETATMPEASFASPRRQRSAILFADVHGYSRLMARTKSAPISG